MIEALRSADVPLSIDTYKPDVMRAALNAGADMVNDIWGLRREGALDAVKDSACGLCVMHMLGEPLTMQLAEPVYRDVVADVRDFFAERVRTLQGAGIAMQRICLDPGFGFGKSVIDREDLARPRPRLCQDPAAEPDPVARASHARQPWLSAARRPLAQVDAGRCHRREATRRAPGR